MGITCLVRGSLELETGNSRDLSSDLDIKALLRVQALDTSVMTSLTMMLTKLTYRPHGSASLCEKAQAG